VTFLKRWWGALLTVLAAIAAGVGLFLAGRSRGRSEGDVEAARDAQDDARELGEAETTAARKKAIRRFVEASEKAKAERDDTSGDLGDYLDRHTGGGD